jgi:hypothetical protein
MDNTMIKKFKWFWAWQDDKEEAWLNQKANKGLLLERVSFPGIYHFRQGKPGQYVYRLDFQSLRAKDRESYFQLFEDAGWEHVEDMGGWIYFRYEVSGNEIPDIYSDQESKLGKYTRLMIYLAAFLPIMMILLPRIDRLEYLGPVALPLLEGISAIILLLYSYSMVSILRRIYQLKNQPEES